MKHAVIAAHPRETSFTLSVARAYATAVEAAGGVAVLRDLYRLRFDPRLSEAELPDHAGFAPAADVVEERRYIGDADVFVLVYPLWLNATPAMMKGYVERVFAMGFAYTPLREGGNQPMLRGRRLLSFTSSGAPQHWVEESGAWAAMRRHFDAHVAEVCGLTLEDHVNFGGVTPGIRADVVERHLAEVAERATRLERNGPGAATAN